MKYHKIYGVALEVCTAEQKIAYNIAFRRHISHQERFDALESMGASESAKSEAISRLCQLGLENFRMSYGYKPGRFDEDAIMAALHAGLRSYLESKHQILGSYEEIGKMFPAHYLEV